MPITLAEQLGYPNVSLGYMDSIAYPGNYEYVAGTPGPPVVGDLILVWTLVTDLSDYSTLGTDPITTPSLSSCTLIDSNETNPRLKWYIFEVTSSPPDPWLEMTMDGIGGGALPGCVYWLVFTGVSGETLTIDDFRLASAELAGGAGPWSIPQPATALTAGDYYNGFALVYSSDTGGGNYEWTSFPAHWTSAAPTGQTKAFVETDSWYDWQNQGSMAMQAYVPYAAGSEETDPWEFTGSVGNATEVAYWSVEFSYSFAVPVSPQSAFSFSPGDRR